MTGRRIKQTLLHIPKKYEVFYTPNHTWTRIINDRTVEIGLSRYACECIESRCFAFFQTEPVGNEVKRMEPFGVIEKINAVFDLVSPVSGRIKEVNVAAIDELYLLNKDPEEIWIVKIEPTHLKEETTLLLTLDQYEEICKEYDGRLRVYGS